MTFHPHTPKCVALIFCAVLIKLEHPRKDPLMTWSPIHLEKKMAEIVILSLDYDGCAEILFEEGQEEGAFKTECDSIPGYKKVTQTLRAVFEELLAAETSGADRVVLFVGSARQFRKWDRYSSTYKREDHESNGLCFAKYADLAERNQWGYNRLLLADMEYPSGQLRHQPLAAGTSMGPLKKNDQGKHEYESDHYADKLKGPVDRLKTRTISHQITACLNDYPEDHIRFVFIDDSLEIINNLTEFFNPDQGFQLPANLTLKLIHHDTSKLFNRKYLGEESHIIHNLAKERIHYKAIYTRRHSITPEAGPSCSQNHHHEDPAPFPAYQKVPAGLFFRLRTRVSEQTPPAMIIPRIHSNDSTINYNFIFNALAVVGCCLIALYAGNLLWSKQQSDNIKLSL